MRPLRSRAIELLRDDAAGTAVEERGD